MKIKVIYLKKNNHRLNKVKIYQNNKFNKIQMKRNNKFKIINLWK